MRIEVKLGGDLKRHGANGAREIESEGPLTVARAMEQLGVAPDADDILVIVNDEIVPPSEHARFELKENDRLALMPQLKGG